MAGCDSEWWQRLQLMRQIPILGQRATRLQVKLLEAESAALRLSQLLMCSLRRS